MIIGLTGRKGVGKSTVARHLCEAHQFVELSFAQPLKMGLVHMLGLSVDQVQHTKEQPDPFWGVTPRALLQAVGTELMRDTLPTLIPEMHDVWIRMMQRSILHHKGRPIVISDCRFDDEAQFLKRMGGISIRICRPETPDAVPDDPTRQHLSEQGAFKTDYVLWNDDSIATLEKTVDEILHDIYTHPL